MSSKSEDDLVEIINNAELGPTRPDRFQSYVFVLNVILGIVISIYSLSNGSTSWFMGAGVLTPFLLGGFGLFFAVARGIDWEREEMVPLMSRTFMIQEFELERYVKYKRFYRFSILIAGYLSIIVTQWIWSLLASILYDMMISVSGFVVLEFFVILLVFMSILFLVALLFWFEIFHRILKSVFSDINQLIEFYEMWQESIKKTIVEQKDAKV